MNEELMNKAMMIGSMVFAGIAGMSTIGVLVTATQDFSLWLLIITTLLGVCTLTAGWGVTYFGHRISGYREVFTNPGEREILTVKQRKELRKARGEVVMERALIEIENERQNIVHNQIEAANDPKKPPHQTRWSPPPGSEIEGRY